MRSPLVSVIIPLYNRVSLVGEAIDSLVKQTYANWEAIIVDDGSEDGSFEYMRGRSQVDKRIKVLRRERQPKGAPTCRNIGIEQATGEYIIFLDSDDLLASFCLESRVSSFQKHLEYDFLVFPMLLFENEIKDSSLLWNTDTQDNDLLRFTRGDSVWSITGPIHKKKFLQSVGGFDELLPFWQDLDLHIQLLIRGARYKKMYHLPPDCFNRRDIHTSISHGGTSQLDKLTTKEAVMKKTINSLQNANITKKEYYQQIAGMLFSFSYEWALHSNTSRALELWEWTYQEKLINNRNFILGYLSLVSKVLSLKANSYLLNRLHQLFKVMLPRTYWRRKSTLAQVPYQGEVRI